MATQKYKPDKYGIYRTKAWDGTYDEYEMCIRDRYTAGSAPCTVF